MLMLMTMDDDNDNDAVDQNLSEEQKQLVQDLFDWLVEPTLDYVRRNCKTFVTTSDMHLVQTLMRLYTSLMDEIIEAINAAPPEMDEQPNPGLLTPQQVGMVYSYVLS